MTNLKAFTTVVVAPFLVTALAATPLGAAMVAAALDTTLGAVLLAWAFICVKEPDQRRAFLLRFESEWGDELALHQVGGAISRGQTRHR